LPTGLIKVVVEDRYCDETKGLKYKMKKRGQGGQGKRPSYIRELQLPSSEFQCFGTGIMRVIRRAASLTMKGVKRERRKEGSNDDAKKRRKITWKSKSKTPPWPVFSRKKN